MKLKEDLYVMLQKQFYMIIVVIPINGLFDPEQVIDNGKICPQIY